MGIFEMTRNLRTLILLLGLGLAPVQASPNFNICRNIAGKVFGPPPSLLPKAGDDGLKIAGEERPIITEFPFSRVDPHSFGEDYLAPARQYRVLFSHRGRPAQLRLVVPVSLEDQDFSQLIRRLKFNQLHRIEQVLKQFPSVILQEIDTIYFVPRHYWNESTYTFRIDVPMSASAQTDENFSKASIEIYPSSQIMPKFMFKQSLQHELGHVMAWANYQNFTPDRRWTEAIDADERPVSSYGQTHTAEDFAEAVRMYLASEGGLKNTLYRIKFRHRFAILDEILEVDPSLLPLSFRN